MGTIAAVTRPTDRQIQVDVLNALDCDPLRRTSFGVTVSRGVVTLLGSVRTRREAWLAEEAVCSTPGVLGIANELHVENAAADRDAAIAEAAVSALAWYRALSLDNLKVIVSDGYITLGGVVDDIQLRGAAERAVRGLPGVRGVCNSLRVMQAPRVSEPHLQVS